MIIVKQKGSRLRVVAGLIVYRCVCALLQQTAFAPDEYWQGPEVAHRLVYGYGHLTWEWTAGIRSYLHPLLYAVVYQGLAWSGLDGWRWLMVRGPQMVHVMLTVMADISVYRLTRVYFEDNEEVAILAWMCQLFSWFGSYCLVRTYSNSIEACLTAYALYAYMVCMDTKIKNKERWDIVRYTVSWVFCAAVCVVLRPASSVFWGCCAVHSVVSHSRYRYERVICGLFVGLGVLGAAGLVDRCMYGRWEFVPWNFFMFNVLRGGSSLYGVNPWHANFTTHMPSMMLSYIPFFILGCVACMRRGQWHLVGAIALYCTVYSIPAHKEIRFLLPALLMSMPIIALGLNEFVARRQAKWKVYAVVFSIQLVAFVYFSLLHQRGQIQVMKTLQSLDKDTIVFLTPCHATPYYSSLHAHKFMRFMDCSPPDFREQVYQANARDMEWMRIPGYDPHVSSERQYFEANPVKVVSSILSQGTTKPEIFVMFASTGQRMQPLLGDYTLYSRHQNCLLTFEENTDCLVDVYVRS